MVVDGVIGLFFLYWLLTEIHFKWENNKGLPKREMIRNAGNTAKVWNNRVVIISDSDS